MKKISLWLGTPSSVELNQRDSRDTESSEYSLPDLWPKPRPTHHVLPVTEVIYLSTTETDFLLPLLDLEQVTRSLWAFWWLFLLSGWGGRGWVIPGTEQSVASRIRLGSDPVLHFLAAGHGESCFFFVCLSFVVYEMGWIVESTSNVAMKIKWIVGNEAFDRVALQ